MNTIKSFLYNSNIQSRKKIRVLDNDQHSRSYILKVTTFENYLFYSFNPNSSSQILI